MKTIGVRLEAGIHRCSTIGYSVAAILVIAVGIILTAAIIGREAFRFGFSGALDIPSYMMGGIIFLGIASAFRVGGLLIISVVTDRLSRHVTDSLRILTLAIGLVVSVIFTWQIGLLTWESWRLGRHEISALGAPFWLPQLPMFLGLLALCLEITVALVHKSHDFFKAQTGKEI